MPLTIEQRDGEYCVVEPDGGDLGCHPTRQEALDQIVAIEVNKIAKSLHSMITGSIVAVKSTEQPLRLMGLVSSNSFRDKEREIIKSQALKEYAEGKTQTKPQQNKLLFWHKGDAIGNIIYAEFYKSFLIEVAEELPDKEINLAGIGEEPVITTVKNVWDKIEQTPGHWRTSVGFRVFDKTDDGIIYPWDKFETSVLLKDYQANQYTISEVIKS